MAGTRPDPVSESTAAARLGRLMQLHRDRHGLTQRALAAKLSLERSGLSQFETGARVPSPEVMDRWYRVLGHLPEVARVHAAAVAERGDHRRSRRSRALQAGQQPALPAGQARPVSARLDETDDHAAGTVPATLQPEATDVRRDQFLTLTGSALVSMLTDLPARPTRITTATLEQLELVTTQQRQLYHALRSSELISAVTGHLHTTLTLLHSPQTDPIRRRLAAIACETAGHAAWLAHDLGDRATAERYYATAAAAGREAGDPALRAYIRGFMSQARADDGDAQEALRLLQSARALAERSATATTRSWLAALEAQTLATLGDRASCMVTLDAAERAIGRARPDLDPGWQYRFDAPRYQVIAGSAHRRLGNPETAERLLTGVLAQLDGSLRRRTEVLVELAFVQLEGQDVDAACWYAHQALNGALDASSSSSLRHLTRLRARLEPWSDTAAVAALDEQLATTL